MGSAAAYGKLQKLIVFGIAASRNPCIDIDPLGFACQDRNECSDVFLIDIPTEPLSAQHLAKLRKHSKGKQQFPLFQCQIESLTGFGIWQQQSADQDVRIKHKSQLRVLQQGFQNLRREPPDFGLLSNLIEHFLE